MSTSGDSGVSHDVLWRIGTWFTRSGIADYDEVVTDALKAFAARLGGNTANIWSITIPTLEAEVRHRWVASPGADLGPGAEMLIDQKVADTLIANGGAMVMSDELLIGIERAEKLGRVGGQSGVAIISNTDTLATVVVVGASIGNWGDAEVDMLRGFATLLRQFDRRIDDERRLQVRLRLDQLVGSGSTRLLSASRGEYAEVIHDILSELSDILAAKLVALVHMPPDQAEAEIVVAASVNPVTNDLLEMAESDYRPASGLVGDSLRQALQAEQEFLFEPTLTDLLGAEAVTAVGLSEAEHRALLMPASLKDSCTTAVLIVRNSDDAWLPEERATTKTIANLIAQARVREAAEEQSAFRLGALEVLGQANAAFIDANPETFGGRVLEVLATVGEFLGLDLLSTWQVNHRDKTYVNLQNWAARVEDTSECPSERSWGEAPQFDRVRSAAQSLIEPLVGSGDGWTSVVIPGGGERVDRLLVASRQSERPWQSDTMAILESLSNTIWQAMGRVTSLAYSSAAFGSAPVGVMIADRHRRIVSCNKALAAFLRVDSPDDLVGVMANDYLIDPPDTSDWKTEDDYYQAEIAFRQADGARAWAKVRVARIEGVVEGDWMWLAHVENITVQRRSMRLLQFQATHDGLTGLPNRRQLLDTISQRLADPSGVSQAMLLLDLDRFKVINDSLGHDNGDRMLVVIADRLRLAVRPGDLVARLGGDEFAVLMTGPTDLDAAQRMAERLQILIREPISLGGQSVYPSSSIGIAISDGQVDPPELLRRADIAMYRAKADGRGSHESFDENLRNRVVERMNTEAGLRGALRNDQLIVHYQPEFSLDTENVAGAEALVRWQHPTRGLLPAGAFIEVAEEAGLLVEIGELVLREACLEAASWPRSEHHPTIAVNLAASQIQREETVDLVRSVLLEVGLPASQLCLEITESSMMRDLVRSERVLGMLKDLGVKLALDDFGTGFSSLAYLKRFPVDILKIDRSFVSDLGTDRDDEKFVNSIIRLADSLGLEVVAEGVESQHQADILRALGCHTVQGYLYAKPGPAEAMRARLAG